MIKGTPNISLLEETDTWVNPIVRPKWKPTANLKRIEPLPGEGTGLDIYDLSHTATRIVAVTSQGVSRTFIKQPEIDITNLPNNIRSLSFYEKLAVVNNREILRLWASKNSTQKSVFTSIMPDAEGLPLTIGPTYDVFWQAVYHAVRMSKVMTLRPMVVLKHIETITNY